MAAQQVNPSQTDGLTPREMVDQALEMTGAENSPFLELGDTGLQRYGGFISEEWFHLARDQNGIKLIREMSDNHPVVGSILFAIRMLMRGVSWSVESASDATLDTQAAELVESCLSDMSTSWQDVLSQVLSFVEFGWSMCEVVYKIRDGENDDDPTLSSAFSDKKIGIKKIALRSQDSLFKFDMDQYGEVIGMWQQPPLAGPLRYIPRDRLMHVRPSSYKDNPLGRSALRNAMVPYLIQKKLQEIEAIGIERDLAGYPVIRAPAKIMQTDASPDERRMLEGLKSILKNIRRDSSEGIILPSDTDAQGKPLYDLSLISSGGSRQIQPDTAITRYDQRIAMTVLADFVMIGNSAGGGRGSYGMAEAKQDMFSTAISAWLDAICEEFNRQVIPRLCKLNNLNVKDYPRLTHTEVQGPNLQQLGAFITSLAGAGASLFPDENLERALREAAGLPEPNPDATPMGRGNPASNINSVGAAPAENQDPQPKPTPAAGGSGAGSSGASSGANAAPGSLQ